MKKEIGIDMAGISGRMITKKKSVIIWSGTDCQWMQHDRAEMLTYPVSIKKDN